MSEDNDGDFSHSLADLMTSLAVVFLIFAVAMVCYSKLSEDARAGKYSQLEAESNKIQQSKLELLNEIKKILAITKNGHSFSTEDKCISIDGDSSPFRIMIRFNGEDENCKNRGLFYDTAAFQLPSSQIKSTIDNITKFYGVICHPTIHHEIDRIQILGHTDTKNTALDSSTCQKALTDPVGKFKPLQCGNLYLSAQRARDVFLKIGQEIISSENKDLFQCFTNKTEISGRGPFDPAFGDNQMSKNESAQRRVEIVINFRQPQVT